jgi:LuxR family maltose regulon positive regulatory protein
MNATGFAATKIQPPRPRRARLLAPCARGAGLARPCCSHAPSWCRRRPGTARPRCWPRCPSGLPAGTALAWVSLDEDDDEQRLCACLCAALEPFDLPWRMAPEALAAQLADGEGAGRARALAELVNALAGADAPHGVIVLDDLHRVALRRRCWACWKG